MKGKQTALLITPYTGGGMVQYAAQMANALSRRLDIVQIVGKGADKSMFDDKIQLHELCVPESTSELGLSLFTTLRKLRNTIRAQSIDIVHLTARHQLFLALIPALRSKPLVYTLHDVNAHSGEYHLTGEIVDRLLVNIADRVLVHGDYNRQAFAEKHGKIEKCESIMHGEYSFFNNYCETDDDYTTPELLFFGRIRPYKDLKTLVEAERLLLERIDDYRLTIAGDGPIDEETARKIAARDTITLLNSYIPNEEVCELFNRCRAVVLPYRDASQTGVVPIAYSFEKPVIASNVGGIPDVVDHGTTGYLVEPERSVELADRCEALLRDPSLARELGQQADGFRREHMDWNSIAREIITCYRQIAR